MSRIKKRGKMFLGKVREIVKYFEKEIKQF